MGLNIVAHRKASLKGFAEGWDDCFVRVKVVNETRRVQYTQGVLKLQQEMREAADKEDAVKDAVAIRVNEDIEHIMRDFAAEVIVGGRVISTDDNGDSQPVDFAKDAEAILAVLEALNYSWVSYIVDIAIGADRLKAASSTK